MDDSEFRPLGSLSMDQRRQHAFGQLKSICVPLLAHARLPASAATTKAILDLVAELSLAIRSVPHDVFSPPLANYIFFPLSALLQPIVDAKDRGDSVLEATMNALAVLVEQWRRAGIEMRILHELWIMAALKLGGPLDPAGPTAKGKGRQVELSEEVQRAVVGVLLALMRPLEEETPDDSDDDRDPLGADIDWDADEPTMTPHAKRPPPPRPPPLLPPPPIPILFHTLTILLSIAAIPTSLPQLQLDALDALKVLIAFYLVPHPKSPTDRPTPSGPSPLLATALPGTASTLSRIALSVPSSSNSAAPDQTRRQPSAAIVAALDVLSLLVVSAIDDDVTRDLRRTATASESAGLATLEELVEAHSNPPPPSSDPEPLLPTPPLTLSSTPGPTLPTPAWLSHTLQNLFALFAALTGLTSHPSPAVRTSLVTFFSTLLSTSSLSLPPARTSHPLSPLLILASDPWPQVSSPALHSLLTAFAFPGNRTTAAAIVQSHLEALPRELLRGDEGAASVAARVGRVALDLLSATAEDEGGAPAGGMGEKASWALVRALGFERVVGTGEGKGMAAAWITGGGGVGHDLGGEGEEWPELRMKWVKEEATSNALGELWVALGKWAAKRGREHEFVERFWGAARGEGAEGALWVLDGVLKGFEGTGKRGRKVVKGVVKSVLTMLEETEVAEDDGAETTPAADPATLDDSLLRQESAQENLGVVSIEHQRGVSLTPSLDSLKPVVASESVTRDARASRRVLLTCLSIRLLSTSASVLGDYFQPHLLQALYHILSHLSPTSHPLLRLHAQHALCRIAYSTSYASSKNLVLANVDYVVNSVSQRLSVARLDPSAPLVLVEMIRLVGEPIVPMVQDLVEDVFEALDDFHGYEDVTVGLWAVLDALMRVMASGVPAIEGRRPAPDPGPRPNPDQDFAAFDEWLVQRKEDQREEAEDDFGPNPQTPFVSDAGPNKEEDGPSEFPEQETVAPTRPQTVGAEILSKALYFLSHSSPFLRSRVLALIASAVPLLAAPSVTDPSSNRQADLLPVIHRAWPYILNRLSDPEPYVVLEAVGLIEALATHVGEFMSRRILDDVWPRLRTLLAQQETLDRQSAVAGKYTASHRVYRSVLRTMRCVARDVPLKEDVLWEQAVLFRRFLDGRLEEELQEAAREVFRALGELNADAVWLALAGTRRDDLPLFLRMEGQGVEGNVEALLLELKAF